MIYNLRVHQVSGFRDRFRVERATGRAFEVTGLDGLGKALKREAVKSNVSPFRVQDSNGRAMRYDSTLGIFVYN
jgi:hypothetical protein